MDNTPTYEQLLNDIQEIKISLKEALDYQDAAFIDHFVQQLSQEQSINQSVTERLTTLVTEQNIQHPKLSAFLSEIIDRLNKMGI